MLMFSGVHNFQNVEKQNSIKYTIWQKNQTGGNWTIEEYKVNKYRKKSKFEKPKI